MEKTLAVACGQEVAVRREGNRAKKGTLSLESQQFLERVRVPELDGLTRVAPDGETVALGCGKIIEDPKLLKKFSMQN